ncbi:MULTISPECIES: AEC family transporter [unclassified Xanthobacter]|uniref:AEC family transporter n=1 Tax=unclassified Xanthobacter TaxID=2623496 RepID=UPI001F199F0A|nr:MULTISPECIES: AEC family transporter [unclassified Xanthobacter]
MATILSALAPVFLIIALGVVLRRVLLTEPLHWVGLEKLTYFVLFPALLVVSAAKADLANVNILAVAGSLIGTVLLLSGLIVAFNRPVRRLFAADGPDFTSFYQGAVRWNTYVVLAVAGGLFGAEGITIAALALVTLIPVVNVNAVLVLAAFAGREPPTARYILAQLARNPYISACLVGAALNVFHVPIPRVLLEFGDILGRASLAVGLLVVGGGLALNTILRVKPLVLASMTLKLVVKPVIAVGLGLLAGLSGVELVVVAIIAGVPSAPAAYVLARQMGGNATLVAEILTLQIIAAAVTLPLVVTSASALAG